MRHRGWIAALGLSMLLAGCAAPDRAVVVGEWDGPRKLAEFNRAPWTFMGHPGEVLTSRNYRVYSTVPSGKVREKILQLLEAGYWEYRKLMPTAPETERPMEAYLFGTRGEWAEFTKRNTGKSAAIFLQIQRGGYTTDDYFVAFYRGGRWGGTDADLWSVTGHEGLHQFSARHAKGRLPPVLEEGLACTYEVVRWGDGSEDEREIPRFNPKVNPPRASSLRAVLESRSAISLEDLVRLHAGSVVGMSPMKIQAFYAEGWALARFLQEYENGKYRARFAKWMADTVSGELYDPTGTHLRSAPLWDPNGVKPLMEHYLGTDMGALSKEFDKWCEFLAREEISGQWNSR